MFKKDKEIIRELAAQTAEIAALPVQEEKREMWRRLNGLKKTRPMVMADQVCWNEMNVNDELTLRCEDKTLRGWENTLKRQLYQWKHFPVDSVVENFFRVKKAVTGFDFGVTVSEHTVSTDDTNSVVSHKFENQFKTMDDLDKVKTPVIHHDEAETKRCEALAHEVFDGLLEVRMDGVDPYLSVWDPISQWMGVENVLYAIADQPEMMVILAKKLVDGYMSALDQLEEQELICGPQSLIHCTGAWTDELPQGADYSAADLKTKNLWMFGLAQMFSTVSPQMFGEYEIELNMPIFNRFGLVYYGCCEPLDRKMKQVKQIPNVRKISVSPWADRLRSAQEIGDKYVFSSKPNPAYLVDFDEDLIRRDLRDIINICKDNGCPLELILKDISTVMYKPERLWRWAEIAMEEVQRD